MTLNASALSPVVQPIRTSSVPKNLALIGWIALVPCWGTSAHAARCAVDSSLFTPTPPPPALRIPELAVIGAGPESPFEAAKGFERPDIPKEPGEDSRARIRREVRTAIDHRDLEGFKRLMPADPTARRFVLKGSGALSLALINAAIPIVRQILQWEPDGLTNKNVTWDLTGVLDLGASSWVNSERLRRAGSPAKHAASPAEQVERFRLVLSTGADPNGRNDYESPLATLSQIPATPEMLEAARLLLERGASLERTKVKDGGFDALVVAAQTQNGEMVRLMLELGKPSQDVLDAALVNAPLVQSNGAVRWLLERGANPNVDGRKYHKLFCPASAAARRVRSNGERDLMRLMIRFKADPNRVCLTSDSPLMVVMHDHELMRGLLEIGADPNYLSSEGEGALHVAIARPTKFLRPVTDPHLLRAHRRALDPHVRKESVAVLLSHGANPNLRDRQGRTPLMLAGPDDGAAIRLLVARGGTIDVGMTQGETERGEVVPIGPVSWAVLRHNDALGRALAKSGEVEAADCGAVYYASQAGASRTLIALLDRKASADVVAAPYGETPLIAAAGNGQLDTVKILLDRHVASIEETTALDLELPEYIFPVPYFVGRQTALIRAAAGGHAGVVRELLRRGADPNHKDARGHSAAEYALASGHPEVAALLQPR